MEKVSENKASILKGFEMCFKATKSTPLLGLKKDTHASLHFTSDIQAFLGLSWGNLSFLLLQIRYASHC